MMNLMMYQGLRDPVAHHAPLQTRDDAADVDPGLDPGPALLLAPGQPECTPGLSALGSLIALPANH